MDQGWYEMQAIRKRRLANSVWVPLRQSEAIKKGSYGYLGFQEEFSAAGSVMIPLDKREEGDKLGWSDIGLMHGQGPWASENLYKPTDIYQRRDGEDLGVELVLVQHFDGGEPDIWHLNQDLVFALNLLREGEKWVRPYEDYLEIVRLRRNDEGRPILMEIRAEHLRDYLAARNMALRVARFLSRQAVVESIDGLNWDEGAHPDKKNDENVRFEALVTKIHEGGKPFGATTAVFHVARNDVDPDDDVPVMGPESDANIDHESRTFQQSGRPLYRVSGEFWINEWIEPAEHSPRVRWDRLPSSCEFIVDSSGERMNADDLNNEDVGRWLWFRSEVVEAVTARRGAALNWYTRDTGNITPSAGYSIHFGVNESHLLTVYAFDIARLPEWQRRFWLGYNVTPEGKVSRELLASQVRADPANTKAPEDYFVRAIKKLDLAAEDRWGEPLFRKHDDVDEISLRVNRFRVQKPADLYGLAKDVSRLIADRINVDVLHKFCSPSKGEKLGSLKSLERALAKITGDKTLARSSLTPLVGIYELRVADAHLPPSELKEALAMVGVDRNSHPMDQGFQLIDAAVIALENIWRVLTPPAKAEN